MTGTWIGILGIVIGILLLLFVYVGTMALYFAIRKKKPSSKFSVEFAIIAIAFFVSFLIKLIIELTVRAPEGHPEPLSLGQSVSSFFAAVYSAVGGLGFEGLSHPTSELQSGFLSAFYTGSSIYAGLIMVSLISARASYEFYSFIRLSLPDKEANVYVFTALNEESITLAESIKEDAEKYNATHSKKKKYKIIFGGPALAPFDTKEELCRRVMADGFYYWTYAKNSKGSIAEILHLNNQNLLDYDKDFMIFAFDAVDHVPQEEDNLELVLEDIRKRREAKKPDGMRIDYFILTKRKINYQAYQRVNEEMKLIGEQDGAPSYVLNLWNEAQEVARITVKQIMKNGLIDALCKQEDKGIRSWTIGFGGTGEAIANEIFVQTPGVSNGKSRPYAANVFDSNVKNAGEVFRANHPGYTFLDDPTWEELVKKASQESAAKKGLPAPVYGFHDLRSDENELYQMQDGILGKTGVRPDVIILTTGDDYRNICYANTIAQWIVNDRATASEKYQGIQYLVVSVFDEDNNHLISSFDAKPTENGRLISICDKQKITVDGKSEIVEGDCFLKILLVNNLSESYSFSNYKANFLAACAKNMTYSLICNEETEEFKLLSELSNGLVFDEEYAKKGMALEKMLAEDAVKYQAEMPPALYDVEDPGEREIVARVNGLLMHGQSADFNAPMQFNLLPLWDKQSNRAVVSVEPFYQVYFRKSIRNLTDRFGLTPLSGKEAEERSKAIFDWKEHAAEVEHDRWTRFHLSDGWVNAPKKEKGRKQHTCITSYEDLKIDNAYTIVYDVMNVLWAVGDQD